AAYCLVKSPSAAETPDSKRRTVGMPVESAQVGVFQSVAETPSDASENSKLSYSHAGFDASTLLNGGNGAKGSSDQGSNGHAPTLDGGLDIPIGLLRCFHCGKPGAERWDMDGRAVHLHEACQQAWADKQEQPRRARADRSR